MKVRELIKILIDTRMDFDVRLVGEEGISIWTYELKETDITISDRAYNKTVDIKIPKSPS